MRFLLLILGGALASCGSSDPEPVQVSRVQMGAAWPLTVEDGAVSCEGTRDAGALYFEREGQKWVLNEKARAGNDAPDITKSGFWMSDPKIAGNKKSLTPLMEAARDACG